MKSLNLLNASLLLSILLILNSNSAAQITRGMNETTGTGLGGNNFIAGTIFSPSGAPINVKMRIRLASPTAGEYVSTTDERGQFVFSGLPSGSYAVTFDGDKDFQSASQQVDIPQSRSQQTYNISIRLVENRNSLPKPGVIDKANLAIPKKALAYYQKAVSLSKDGNNEKAMEQLNLAVREYPKFTMAFNEIAVQYLKLNELEKAKEALQSALSIDSEAFEPMVNYGIVLYRLKSYQESEIALRKVLKSKDSAIGFFYHGRTLAALEKYEEAEKSFLSAIKIGNGELKESHRMLANVYINLGDKQNAIEQLTTYLKLVPNPPDLKRLKEVLEQLKN